MIKNRQKIPLLFYWLGMIAIFTCVLCIGYKKTFDLFLLPTMNTPFVDFPRTQIAAYPSTWGNLADLLHLNNNINFFFLFF